MTVSKLIKLLQSIQDKHGPRTQVVVGKETLWDGNGTFNVCDVHDAVPDFVRLCDGDGFTEVTKRGFVRGSVKAIIRGTHWQELPTQAEQNAKPKETPTCQK